MKNQKSKSNLLRINSIPDSLKKQIAIQKEVTKKYQKFKKSASQPAYFLNQSRLKKISQVYRVASLQKLSKNYSLNRSKSLHNNITPQKKQTPLTNASFKRQSGISTLNMNKAFETTQKTRRLRLDKTLENQNSHTLETPTLTTTKFFTTQVERLEEINKINTEKAFIAQYDFFFKNLKEDCFGRKGCTSEIKSTVSKFCYLMQQCQTRIYKMKQREQNTKLSKIQSQFSTVSAQLKKKSFKLQLLIKQIDQLKVHNMKIAKELFDLKQERRVSLNSQKSGGKKGRLRINNVFQMRLLGQQSQLSTPVYLQSMDNSNNNNNINIKHNTNNNSHSNSDSQQSNQQSFIEQKKKHSQQQQMGVTTKVQKVFSNYNNVQVNNNNAAQSLGFPINQRLQMIKRIRELQKKQRELVRTLMVLKTDGVDVERAFNEVVTGQVDSGNVDASELNLQHQRMPSYIKKIHNNSSYDADSSIVESIEGLTVRCFDGQPQQQYIFYPIKHEHKSKQLDSQMQNRLKLNFEVLYQDYQQPQMEQDSESSCSQQQVEESQGGNNPPTI